MRLRLPLFLLLPLFLCALAGLAQVTAFNGRVVGVVNGNSITVIGPRNKEYKVRLAGIDAPEAGQDFAEEAKEYLGQLINGKSVTVIGRKSDRFGRLVAQVFLHDPEINRTRDIGYSLLTAGLAWHYKEFAGEQTKDDQKLYSEAEELARTAKLRIWSSPNPVAPWDHRRAQPPVETEGEIVVEVVGNRNSKIYHWNPGCPDFFKIAAGNKVPFKSKAEAEAAGYRPAKNCRQ